MENRDWDRLTAQLRSGDCTPFLGAGACSTIPTSRDLSEEWARRYDYPFEDDHDLARVMQFAAMEVGDPVTLKQIFCQSFRGMSAPDFADPGEPHGLLAQYPIKVFITTNYDNFLVRALVGQGKRPASIACSWYTDTNPDRAFFDSPAGERPPEHEPIVYHLHGNMDKPNSLVLTEKDYLEYLVKLSGSWYDKRLSVIPDTILSALTDNPLLFIGYSLQDWTFRVLFHSLLGKILGVNRRRHVSVQLLPPVNKSAADAEARAQAFLADYLKDWNITIFWGTAEDFCRKIRQRIEGQE